MDDNSFLFNDPSTFGFGTSNVLSGEAGNLSGPGTYTAGTNGVTNLSGDGTNWGGLAKGIFGLGGAYLNQQANSNAQDALGSGLQSMLTQADPFSSSRQQYVGQLNDFMSNPSQFLQTPYAQSIMQAGSQGVDRSMAAKGYLGSGNEAIALQRQGQTDASGLMQQQFNNLFQLSGAGQGQLAGADIMGNIAGLNAAKATNGAAAYNAYAPQAASGSSGIGSSLGTLGGSMFGGPIGGAIGGALGGLFDSIF